MLYVTIPTSKTLSQQGSVLCSAIPHRVCIHFHQVQALPCSLAYVSTHTCQTSEKYRKDVPHGFDKD